MFKGGYTKLNQNGESLHGDEAGNTINPMVNVELSSRSGIPLAENNNFSIKVLCKEKSYDVGGMTTESKVGDLKRVVAELTEIPVHRQRLVLTGKPLKPDDKTLSFFKIGPNSSIHLFPIPEATAAAVPLPSTATNVSAVNQSSPFYPSAASANGNPPLPLDGANIRAAYYDITFEQVTREVRLWCFVLLSLSFMELFNNFSYFTTTGKLGTGTLDTILFMLDTVCSVGGIWVGSMGMKSIQTLDLSDIKKYVHWLFVLFVGCFILRILWVADIIEQVQAAVKESKANSDNPDNGGTSNTDDPNAQKQVLDDRAVVALGVQVSCFCCRFCSFLLSVS
jgi:hypothetical protein